MQISSAGRAFIRSHEGDVLKAYRCPAGIWTIGVGLTAGSGVVKPKAGMVISRAESDRLLGLALERNYEPRVRMAMPGAKQHEHDGGTSFDFNTGAIHKASWVGSWRAKAGTAKVRAGLMSWVKGGGKVLPGLKRRRGEEAELILFGDYPKDLNLGVALPLQKDERFSRWVVSMVQTEREAAAAGFKLLGYEPGPTAGEVEREAVEAFQAKHDLTVDGLIGRATLSMLQRELDARKKVLKGTGTAGGGGAVAGGNEAAAPASPAAPSTPDAPDVSMPEMGDAVVTWLGVAIGVAGVLYLLWLAWRYRDLVAARIAKPLPKVAAWLRSF